MAHSQYSREAAQIQQAHPGLDDGTARRTAEAYTVLSAETGTDVKSLAAESLRAENSSAAGNDTAL